MMRLIAIREEVSTCVDLGSEMMKKHKSRVLEAMEVAANIHNGITHVGGKEKGTEGPRTRKGVIRKASKTIGPNPDRKLSRKQRCKIQTAARPDRV